MILNQRVLICSLIILISGIDSYTYAQERVCPDGKRSYFGVCPDDGSQSRPLTVAEPKPDPKPVPILPKVDPASGYIEVVKIIDGYPSGSKIHMVGGDNGGKLYLGFILNILPKTEDRHVLRGEFLNAFNIYNVLDQQGDLTATHNIGLMLIRGLGVNKNTVAGMAYLEKSMQSPQNYATAKYFLDKAKKEIINCFRCQEIKGEYNLTTSTVEVPKGYVSKRSDSWQFSKGRLLVKSINDRHLLLVLACQWSDSPNESCDDWWTVQIRDDGVYLQDMNTSPLRFSFDLAKRILTIIRYAPDGAVRTDRYQVDDAPLTDPALIRRQKRAISSFDGTIKDKTFGDFSAWKFTQSQIEFK